MCNDGYIKGVDLEGKPACLVCKEGTWNPENRTCVATPFCANGLVAARDSTEGKMKCFPLGNCLNAAGAVSNSQPYYYSVFPQNSRPINTNLTWTYVSSNPQENKCQYTCEPGAFYYALRGRCQKTSCFHNNSDANLALFIDNIPS